VRAGAAAGAATLFVSAALVLSAGAVVAGYPDGAPPGFSGGFKEQSCHACHFHADLDSGPGRVVIAGVPGSFSAGERYPVTVTLTRSGMKLAGFQLTARFKDGGAQAGSLAPAPGEEGRLGIEVQDGIQYVNQRGKGTTLAVPDTTTWSLVWTAPKAVGQVVFHVAANAANADETAEGDHIHTTFVEVTADRTPSTGLSATRRRDEASHTPSPCAR
jgi:hypothetical protein